MRPAPRLILCLVFLLGAGSRFALAEAPPSSPPAALSKGDALLVRIEGIGGGLPEYREIVDSDGNIEVPFLGFLSADGKSIAALEAEMAAAYAKARLSSNAVVQVTYVTHFVPPPDRANLVRIEDPRRPVPASQAPAAP
ncbi:MAG TPA: hypothetical protein DCM68_05450 [Verrucomicrobia bacterium]|nr:hypothetical protein [Verrucomicrobiota bacterium]